MNRTQWEIAGFSSLTVLAAAICTITYYYGAASSQSEVKALQHTVESYKNSSALNTEEFLSKATDAADSLKLSIDERLMLERQVRVISNLEKELKGEQAEVERLQADLSETNQKVELLQSKLANIQLKRVDFSLSQGEAKSLRGGSVQVGFKDYNNYSNRCNVYINNESEIMSAGEYKVVGECKVVVTACSYTSGGKLPAKFELLCP
ncbi:hypothetical protein [Vibrio sp. WZ-1]|uniref:hypothetical protein n=1 Tax=Vibrio sp. WZ-1 TaxID=3454501 RepID=UPI003F852309